MHRFEFFNHKCWWNKFKQKLQLSYFWSAKGKKTGYKNIVFKRSFSIILAIAFKRNWFEGIKINTIDSSLFIQFLANLDKWIKCNNRFYCDQILLILDNCPTHF